jgi:hypothetical protein
VTGSPGATGETVKEKVMTKKNPQNDGYFSNSDENFELNPDLLEKVAGGRERHFTLDPNAPDFDTFMYYGEEYWEKYCKGL